MGAGEGPNYFCNDCANCWGWQWVLGQVLINWSMMVQIVGGRKWVQGQVLIIFAMIFKLLGAAMGVGAEPNYLYNDCANC